jgi:hypothetical protein
MRCPKCGLESPSGASWCDCGYDFSTGEAVESHTHARPGLLKDLLTGHRGFRWTVATVSCTISVALLVLLQLHLPAWAALGFGYETGFFVPALSYSHRGRSQRCC